MCRKKMKPGYKYHKSRFQQQKGSYQEWEGEQLVEMDHLEKRCDKGGFRDVKTLTSPSSVLLSFCSVPC